MEIEIEYDILPVNTGYTDKQKCVLVSYFQRIIPFATTFDISFVECMAVFLHL
jgi:hypothetical protein